MQNTLQQSCDLTGSVMTDRTMESVDSMYSSMRSPLPGCSIRDPDLDAKIKEATALASSVESTFALFYFLLFSLLDCSILSDDKYYCFISPEKMVFTWKCLYVGVLLRNLDGWSGKMLWVWMCSIVWLLRMRSILLEIAAELAANRPSFI